MRTKPATPAEVDTWLTVLHQRGHIHRAESGPDTPGPCNGVDTAAPGLCTTRSWPWTGSRASSATSVSRTRRRAGDRQRPGGHHVRTAA
jgi:hypothetical protein